MLRSKKRLRWTPELDYILEQEKEQGRTWKEIAEKLGGTESAVQNRLGILRRSTPSRFPSLYEAMVLAPKIEMARSFYRYGMSVHAAATEAGINPFTLPAKLTPEDRESHYTMLRTPRCVCGGVIEKVKNGWRSEAQWTCSKCSRKYNFKEGDISDG